jgi:hypothetical protein
MPFFADYFLKFSIFSKQSSNLGYSTNLFFGYFLQEKIFSHFFIQDFPIPATGKDDYALLSQRPIVISLNYVT